MNIFRQIKKSQLFYNFTDTEINEMFDHLTAKIVKYSRGQLIAKNNTEVNEIAVVLEGNLLEFVIKPNKEKQVQNSLLEGDLFGAYQAFSDCNLLGYSVVSALDSTVLYIGIDSILNRSESSAQAKLYSNLLKYLSNKIIALEENKDYITTRGMRQKIAKLILEKYNEQQKLVINLGINRNEMAKYLHVSRPSMSREMIRMRDEGIFDFWKDQITIHKIEELRKIIES